MSRNWWVISGILVLVAGLYTWYDISNVPQNEEKHGIYRRWYDGTLEKKESLGYSGKVARRTIYGDDGQTILRYEEYDYYKGDTLVELHTRLEDGRMREQRFEDDGKTLRWERVLSGNLAIELEQRDYRKGVLTKEIIRSEDGKLMLSEKQFYPDGKRKEEILAKNGEMHSHGWYPDGKRRLEYIGKLNGDVNGQEWWEDGKTVKKERQQSSGKLTVKQFSRESKLLISLVEDEKGIVVKVYDEFTGKLSWQQEWKPSSRAGYLDFQKVDEFDADEKLQRRITSVANNRELLVQSFNDKGQVTKELTCDFDGTVRVEKTFDPATGAVKETKTHTRKDGVSANFDRSRLRLPKDVGN